MTIANAYRIKGEVNDKGEKVTPDTFNTKADASGVQVTAQSIGKGRYIAVKNIETGEVYPTDQEMLTAKRNQLDWVAGDSIVKDKHGKDKHRKGRIRKAAEAIEALDKTFKGATSSKYGTPWNQEEAQAVLDRLGVAFKSLQQTLLHPNTKTKGSDLEIITLG